MTCDPCACAVPETLCPCRSGPLPGRRGPSSSRCPVPAAAAGEGGLPGPHFQAGAAAAGAAGAPSAAAADPDPCGVHTGLHSAGQLHHSVGWTAAAGPAGAAGAVPLRPSSGTRPCSRSRGDQPARPPGHL